MPVDSNVYVGKSAEYAVLSELLYRNVEVALATVDRGVDLFLIQDRDALGTFSRLQVKSYDAPHGCDIQNCSAKFQIKTPQLRQVHEPELHYVFTVRGEHRWENFLIISRRSLEIILLNANAFATGNQQVVNVTIVYNTNSEGRLKAQIRNADVSNCLNAWEAIPVV